MTGCTYTREEFAEAFWRRGYGRKKQAERWLKENAIDQPTEADFMHCYHAVQDRLIQRHDHIVGFKRGRYVCEFEE